MNPVAQPLLSGDLGEQLAQLLPLAAVERGAQIVLVLPRDAPELLELCLASGRQAQSVRAPVCRIGAALDQALFLQLVEQQHEPLGNALYYLIFATGGPGYSVPLGLLCAGISVPALLMGLLPRWPERLRERNPHALASSRSSHGFAAPRSSAACCSALSP